MPSERSRSPQPTRSAACRSIRATARSPLRRTPSNGSTAEGPFGLVRGELYAGLLKWHILPQLGGRQLASISPLVVRQWHAGLMAGHLGPVSVAKCYRLLKTVMATAVEDGFIVKSPCVIKGAGVERSAERPIATIEQVDCLAAAIEPRFRALVLLATYGSLRFGELAALTRRRVDLKAGTVSVVVAQSELGDGTRLIGEPKTAAGRRVVAIPPVILEELQHHLAVFSQPGPDGLVFVGPKGAALRRGNFSHVWKKAARSVGLEDLHFHDLRHTGNTLAATTGASTCELIDANGPLVSASGAALPTRDGGARARHRPRPRRDDRAGASSERQLRGAPVDQPALRRRCSSIHSPSSVGSNRTRNPTLT